MKRLPYTPRSLDNVSASVRALNPSLFAAPPPPQIPEQTKADFASERELQKLCEQELSRRGIWFIHLSHRAREKVGCPDILACVNGVAFACELKSATGKLSEDQKSTLEQMAGNGWKTCVVRSFTQFLEEIGKQSTQPPAP